MNRKLLIGIIVVFSTVWFAPLLPFSLAVWPYLVWMVLKKNVSLFRDQMEPKLAERYLRRLKTFLLVAGISLVVGIVATIVHNALYSMNELEDHASFYIAWLGLWAFSIATISGFYIFRKGRRKTT